MNKLYRIFIPLAALLALLVVAACGGDGDEEGGGASPTLEATPAAEEVLFSCDENPAVYEPDASAFPVTVTDDQGEEMTLDEPPASIVSLSAGHTEVLYAIGAGGQVKAGDAYSDCPLAAAALPHIDAFSPSVESLVELEPDLVIIFYDPGGLRDSLQAAGIPVLFLNAPESIDGVYAQMKLLGALAGHAEHAEHFAASMKARVDELTEQIADVQVGPRVFHEMDSTYYTAGPGSFIADLYDALKAQNIAEATGQPYPQLTAEAIIDADPEVIVLADEDAGESAETVSARAGWGAISAVEEGRIYAIDPDIISRPGPRLLEALETLAAYLYPETFE